jgi:hypothetical protein
MKRLSVIFFTAGLLLFLNLMNFGDNLRGWKGTVRYTLDLKEDIYRQDISFMKLKGLQGQDYRKIVFKGEITFLPTNRPDLFVAKGDVNYEVSLISVARLGQAMVVHLTDGKGKEKVEPVYQINYLRIDRESGTYSLAVSPGIEDEDMGAFGVLVETVSYMKVTRAFLEKMESENRDVPFPEMLKRMFPDVKKETDRESIAGEAFGRPFTGTGVIKDSVKDENGGIFSWNLSKVALKNIKPMIIQDQEEDEFDEY